MRDKKTFEIVLITKIPYLTTGLSIIFFVSFLLLSFFSNIFFDSNTSPETQTFYIMNISEIKLPYYLSLLFMTTFVLYLLARHKNKGLIIFHSNSFELISKKGQQVISFESARRVYCNDSENKDGSYNKKFTMTIETWKNKKILVRLQKTTDIKQFIEKLLNYDQLKIEYSQITTVD